MWERFVNSRFWDPVDMFFDLLGSALFWLFVGLIYFVLAYGVWSAYAASGWIPLLVGLLVGLVVALNRRS